MCDVYIYYFVMSQSQAGDNMLSARPAKLETINDRGGVPVMESQLVVDHTELDGDGFLVAPIGDPHEINDIAGQIRSLEVRAVSRDSEAISSTDEKKNYMLRLESRELRKQARVLKTRRTEIMAGELDFRTDARDFIHFGAGVAT